MLNQSQPKASLTPQKREFTYQDYLRSKFIYGSYGDLKLKRVSTAKLISQKPKSELCEMHFLAGHECLFGKQCIYAHSVSEVQQNDEDFRRKHLQQQTGYSSAQNQKQLKLFQNFGIWPSTVILGYLNQQEIIDISRLNKEAHYIAKKVFTTRKINLERINLRLIKFFSRTQKLKITRESLGFFETYKESLFNEILLHYNSLQKVIINFNYFFREQEIDQLLQRLSRFRLRPTVTTLQIEDGQLTMNSFKILHLSALSQNILNLNLPRCNLGDAGALFVFTTF